MLTFSQLRYYQSPKQLWPSFFIEHDGDLTNARVIECEPGSYTAEMERARADGHQTIELPLIRGLARAKEELRLLIAQQRAQSSGSSN